MRILSVCVFLDIKIVVLYSEFVTSVKQVPTDVQVLYSRYNTLHKLVGVFKCNEYTTKFVSNINLQ
jgi:hypothetical protein